MMAMYIQSKLPLIIWNDERVVTAAQLAEVYGTDVNNTEKFGGPGFAEF